MPTMWSPVALSRDVPPLVVMPIVVGGRDLVLWRSASGRLAAWTDRCPHRGMRLSHGFVRGDALSCIYHGWSYGSGGNCLRIPAHPDLAPPETIRVPVHAAAEASGVIWVAEAEPETPPPDLGAVVPLRSLTVEAAAETVAALSGLTGVDLLRGTIDGVAVAIAVQPVGAGRCVLHVLTGDATPAARVAVSRQLEALRRQAEASEMAA
jgi:nitrite reductase/ring-hydroxylating ferredoxin subunit